jgi:phenylacetate-CoA ligase
MSEYVCVVEREAGRDAMTVHIETRGQVEQSTAEIEAFLKERLGVEIAVALAVPGALSSLTQIESRQKPIRLIDKRKAGA